MAAMALLALLGLVAGSAGAAAAKKQPNFVYVLCDDMNELLGDEAIVKQTRALIADKGARAANAFVSSPKCTPSRSAWLSGRYYHNLRPGQSEGAQVSGKGLNTTHFFDHDAVFPQLHQHGYQTALFGKIHNDQAEWLCHPTNHTEPFTHIETECSPCGNYFPNAFVVKKSADALHTSMETLPSDPAENATNCSVPLKPCRGSTSFFCPTDKDPHQAIADSMNISAPRSPNFNMLASDHFDLLATHPILTPDLVGDIDSLMRQRWGTLLSIDDLVAGLHNAVDEAGLLDNTYFLYSSDHVRIPQYCNRAQHSAAQRSTARRDEPRNRMYRSAAGLSLRLADGLTFS
jgi:N-acetylglucosamine-6-sulfatase